MKVAAEGVLVVAEGVLVVVAVVRRCWTISSAGRSVETSSVSSPRSVYSLSFSLYSDLLVH